MLLVWLVVKHMLLLWLLVVETVGAYRLDSLDTSGSYPFTDASGLFWHLGELGGRLQGARMVDVSSRGVRLVTAGTLVQSGTRACAPCTDALCCAAEGPVLPQSPGPFDVSEGRRTACVSDGRRYAPSGHTVLACEALRGDGVLLYDLRGGTLREGHDTYGGVSYVLVLACLLSCLVGMSTDATRPAQVGAAFCGAAGTALLVVVHRDLLFPTLEDERLLWAAFALHCLSLMLWWMGGHEVQDVYFYSICMLLTATHRTVEHPYAALLALHMLTRMGCALLRRASSGGAALVLQAAYLGLVLEYGVIPQVAQPESWPLYFGAVCLVTAAACAAWVQHASPPQPPSLFKM